MEMNRMLLNRNALSRERSDSMVFSVRRRGSRSTSRARHSTTTDTQKPANHGPREDLVKECTEETTPLRVMKVPKMDRQKVIRMSRTFQTFIIPFFSWIITEWMKAVMVSQGIREAFSTGSQAQ